MLAQNLIQVVDTAFLGRVGEVELGASALAGIIYIVIYTFGFGFSMGSQILIGRRNGEKNYNQIGDIVVQGALFLFLPSLLLIPFLRYGSVQWLPAIFESAEVGRAVAEYLEWRVFGLVFAFINLMFRAFFIGIARTKILTLNAVIMGLVNVFFDYGLIFGNLGMPELGIGGAAIASVIAEFASTLFFLFYLKKKVDLNKYGFTKIRFQFDVIKKTLNISIFMMIQYLFSVSTWLLFFLFIENYMGERSLAVTNVVRSLYTVVTIPSHAIGSATSTLVSNTIGAGKQSEVLQLIKRLTLISLGVMVIMMLIIGVLPRLVVHIYTDDPLLINEIIAPLYVMLSSLPLYSIGTVLFSSISGTGNTRSALKIEIISLIFYVTYMWFIIVYLRSSVALAWTTEHVYWFLLTIIPFFYLRKGKWKEKKI
ncbi:MAG: MATE family efflux transporter [Fermentimonas sp.]|nr:MATE family efflux transporter [Fermentimonas sp.]